MTTPHLLLLSATIALSRLPTLQSFSLPPPTTRRSHDLHPRHRLSSLSLAQRPDDSADDGDGTVDEYRNVAAAFLSNFLRPPNNANASSRTTTTTSSTSSSSSRKLLSDIDFQAKKAPKMPIEKLASILDRELYEREWFVTGNVNPMYFDDKFRFQDPDVKVTGLEEYVKGVRTIFDQTASRAQILSTLPSPTVPNTITVTWRLSGRVNIGPAGLPIKPYICYTDFAIDEESGLIVFQEDRFDIPGWDILISAFFPFLVGRVGFLREPAEEVEERVFDDDDNDEDFVVGVGSGKRDGEGTGGIFGGIFQKFGL